jgi:hypothetical protein
VSGEEMANARRSPASPISAGTEQPRLAGAGSRPGEAAEAARTGAPAE